MHHFRVDPYIHSRVWFTTVAKGTHTGTLAGTFEPTGKAFQSPPQSCRFVALTPRSWSDE
eukprot:706245-Pyramimonas_sp.AAC.1